MSIRDFVNTVAPPPDWLTKTWSGAKRRGLDKLAMQEIDAEIGADRTETLQSGHEPR